MDMRLKRKNILAFSIIAILILFQAAAAHSYYDSLIEADFLGGGLKFEAADLDTLYVDKQVNLALCTGTASACSLLKPGFFEPSALEDSASLPSVKAASVLRC